MAEERRRSAKYATQKDNKELYQMAAVAMYIVDGNKTAAYRFYMMCTSSKTATTNDRIKANQFFAQPAIMDMVELKRNRAKQTLLEGYLEEVGLSKGKIAQLLATDKSGDGQSSFDEIIGELSYLGQFAESESVRVQALGKRADVEGIKKQSKAGDSDNIIHCLPLAICDTCPNKDLLLSKYQDEEDVWDEAEKMKEAKKSAGVIANKVYGEDIDIEDDEEYVPAEPEEI